MQFTVITINYNNREGLRKTMESVVAQTCRDFEFVVIDGGSTDGSVDVIREYGDRIDYWVSEPDNGIYNAMNKGVAHAHGEYCLFMNSGDCLYDSMVLEAVDKHNPTEDVVVGKVSIDEQDHIVSPPPSGDLTLYHLYSGAIPHQASFIRTTLLKKHPYDETLKITSDWKFFIQALIIDNGTIRYIDTFVARYDTNGLSSNNPQLMRQEKEMVLAALFPPRILADYKQMKLSECQTQALTPRLRQAYTVDRLVHSFASFLLKLSRH